MNAIMNGTNPIGIVGGSATTTVYSNTTSGLVATNVQSAIDEIVARLPIEMTGTLTAGQTTITFSNNKITANSTIDYYTDVFGINPVNIAVINGAVTLTFNAQGSDVGVKVRIS